ncbi:MAG: hypothetical protein FWH18_00025 [Marinilabiliaceae bacterium]|nr:hypothetical protein [Marinilabiliaceae bacterium]
MKKTKKESHPINIMIDENALYIPTKTKKNTQMKKRKKEFDVKDMKEEELDMILEWSEKYIPKIVDVYEGRLAEEILYEAFNKFLFDDSFLDNYREIGKHRTRLPINIMIDENEVYIHTKTPQIVVCTDDNWDFIGVVSIENTKEAVFIDDKYNYLQKEISLWIEKYREFLQKVADNEIDTTEFVAKLEYDFRNQ